MCVLIISCVTACGSNSQPAPEVAPTTQPSPTATRLPHILEAVSQGNLKAVQQRLDAGIDVNGTFVQDSVPGFGGYSLHLPVLVGHTEITELLLKNGADINIRARDQHGGTPLHWTAFAGNKPMTELLVEAGANINAPDYDGFTPLDAALSNPDLEPNTKIEVADFLRNHGANTRK